MCLDMDRTLTVNWCSQGSMKKRSSECCLKDKRVLHLVNVECQVRGPRNMARKESLAVRFLGGTIFYISLKEVRELYKVLVLMLR